MKGILLAIVIFLGVFPPSKSSAQVKVNLNVNIAAQPDWGPTGYDHVDYYYLPDINCYYDVSRAQYIYQDGNNWKYISKLPERYKSFDVYTSYKVIINGRPNPFNNNRDDITKYGKYKNHRGQGIIRDSHEEKYFVNKGNRYRTKKR